MASHQTYPITVMPRVDKGRQARVASVLRSNEIHSTDNIHFLKNEKSIKRVIAFFFEIPSFNN